MNYPYLAAVMVYFECGLTREADSNHLKRRSTRTWRALATIFLLSASLGANESVAPRPNVLIVIADDLGVDRVQAYGHRNQDNELVAPMTPNIDRLAKQGVLFRNAWAAPSCSPARAMALTGLYPNRTGVGRFISLRKPLVTGLRSDLVCLPSCLPEEYVSAAVGKWHLATPQAKGGMGDIVGHATRCGFDFFSGTVGNFGSQKQTYYNYSWARVARTAPEKWRTEALKNTYATTYTTDTALKTIREFGEQPWLLWVAYHAPHKPYHTPPGELVRSKGLDPSTKLGKGKAIIEALDTEIGRLLAGVEPEVMANTIVVFFGDNGTQKDLVEPPFDPTKAKSTVYNGGVHIPLIVAGGVLPETSRGRECHALVDLTDLFPTVAELLGAPIPTGLDGRSFMGSLRDPQTPSAREWVYSERFTPNFVPKDGERITRFSLNEHHQTVRGKQYKLVRLREFEAGALKQEVIELYNIESDLHETQDLLDSEGQPPAGARKEYEALLEIAQQLAK
ncbi:MAG: arylsulfatase B [Candidatus Paceibacteria bacterium]|jgi:arylsulfatase B